MNAQPIGRNGKCGGGASWQRWIDPDFAGLLRRYRRRNRLTQEELAERAGLSAASVSLLERGITLAPQRATVSMLSDALALTPDEAIAFLAQARGRVGDDDSHGCRRGSSRGNLPFPADRVDWREREEAMLLELLGRETTRLLTLTGPAGVGKTRLALELAATLRHERARTSSSSGSFPCRSLNACSRPSPRHSTSARATACRCARRYPHAARPRLVFVLDNFEQVLPAARTVLELLIGARASRRW